MKKSSKLNALDSYRDANGLLRVRGQIKKANLSESLENSVIVPKTGHITELVLRHAYKKTHYSGRGVTLNELLSSGHRNINENAAVRHFISRCVTCRYHRGTFENRKWPTSQVFILCGGLFRSMVY